VRSKFKTSAKWKFFPNKNRITSEIQIV